MDTEVYGHADHTVNLDLNVHNKKIYYVIL